MRLRTAISIAAAIPLAVVLLAAIAVFLPPVWRGEIVVVDAAAAVGLAIVLSGFRARMTQLHRAVHEVSRGNMETVIPDTRGDEVGEICASFNRMVKNVRAAREGLEAEVGTRQKIEASLRLDELRLEALLQLNQMADATLREITDFSLEAAVKLTSSAIGYLAFLNDDESVMTMHSWSKSAMAQCAIQDKPMVYPVVTTGLWGEAVRQRRAVITNDYQLPSPWKKGYPDGHVAVLRHMNVPIFDEGRIVAVSGVGNKAGEYDESDIRQISLLMQGMWGLVRRKREKEAMARRAAELAALNRELESFAFTVSHDLWAPLRAIDGFSRLLSENQHARLDDQGKDHLKRIRAATVRMGELIDDLLNLSRLTRKPMQCQAVDLTRLARSVAAEMGQNHAEHEVDFCIAEGLQTEGDDHLLRNALSQLIGNACKFTAKKAHARVEVGRYEEEGHDVFYVRDNGAGFDMNYADKLFAPFQRLHTSEEFEGTGIGLATVQRIVARHGGKVWAEGAVGEGATFYFTLGRGEPRHA